MQRNLFALVLALCASFSPSAHAEPLSPLDACLAGQSVPRLARVVGPDGAAHFASVVAAHDGAPTRVAPLAGAPADLAGAVAALRARSLAGPVWEIAPGERARRVCAPLPLSRDDIDAERVAMVAVGLNYRAHAEEAGGGEIFLFPKPPAPTPPYGRISPPEGVALLDYEVELGFALLDDVSLADLPDREAFLERSVFFLANDVSDREPIVAQKAVRGPGTGFVEGKGQPGFSPLGPWAAPGRELFAALAACGAEGLGLRLAVDEGEGFRPRQASDTSLMIVSPHALLARIADEVERAGPRSPMPLRHRGRVWHYPLAVGDPPRLPAGSVVYTGTPEGVALHAPSPLRAVLRGIVHLRGPFAQVVADERARAEAGGPGGYLEPGDVVRASIDGLGAQVLRIEAPGRSHPDPCGDAG